MKKNDIISRLQEMPGNPEVVFFNGATGYHHSVSKNIEEDVFVKYSEEHIFLKLQFKEMKSRNSFDDLPEEVLNFLREKAKKIVKETVWEVPNPHHKKEDYKEFFGKNQKKVIVFNLLPKGIAGFDRLGTFDC